MNKQNPFLFQLELKANTPAIALQHKGKSHSYRELKDESQKMAGYLKSLGCKKGDTALLATETGFELLTIIYATLILEMKVALIDPHMGRELYNQKLEQLKPQWAFIDSRLLLLQEHPILRYAYLRSNEDGMYIPHGSSYGTIATGVWLPLLQKHKKLRKYGDQPMVYPTSSFEDFEYIITYTSGTLKEPKGVVHTVQSVYQSIEAIVKVLKSENTTSITTHLPHFMLIGICSGITVHLWDEKWSSRKKLEFIKENEIQGLFGPPAEYLSLINYCYNWESQFPDCLKLLMLGSAPVHRPFLKRLISFTNPQTAIKCIYGMTEHLVVSIADGRKKMTYNTDGDLLGSPLETVDIKISKDSEILVRSNQLFKGYLNQDPGTGYHPTGDLGRLDENDKLILVGRKKDMIIRRNFNIYPALYEPTIKQIDGIDEAVLIGIYDESKADEKVFLCIEGSNELKKEDVIRQLQNGKNNIDIDAIPDHVVFRTIPRMGRQQKIDRKKLRTQLAKAS